MRVLQIYMFLSPLSLSLSKHVLRFILSHTLKAVRYKDGQVATSALELKVNI